MNNRQDIRSQYREAAITCYRAIMDGFPFGDLTPTSFPKAVADKIADAMPLWRAIDEGELNTFLNTGDEEIKYRNLHLTESYVETLLPLAALVATERFLGNLVENKLEPKQTLTDAVEQCRDLQKRYIWFYLKERESGSDTAIAKASEKFISHLRNG